MNYQSQVSQMYWEWKAQRQTAKPAMIAAPQREVRRTSENRDTVRLEKLRERARRLRD